MSRKLIPMLYSTPMAAANMAGNKTETRRMRGLEAYNLEPDRWVVGKGFVSKINGKLVSPIFLRYSGDAGYRVECPYGKPGDVLWMRETFEIVPVAGSIFKNDAPTLKTKYKADNGDSFNKWKPNLHMPLAACRYFAEIVNIRLDRLNDITEEGVVAEGITLLPGETEAWKDWLYGVGSCATARGSYASLWESINGPSSWDSNPWVWVVQYRRMHLAEVVRALPEMKHSYTPAEWQKKHDTIVQLYSNENGGLNEPE